MSELLTETQLGRLAELRSKCVIPLDKTEGAVHKISYWTESGSVAEELDPDSATFLIGAGGLIDLLLKDIAEYKARSQNETEFREAIREASLKTAKELLDVKEELRIAQEALGRTGQFATSQLSAAIIENRAHFEREIESLHICFKSNTAHIKDLQTIVQAMGAAGVPGIGTSANPAMNPLTSG